MTLVTGSEHPVTLKENTARRGTDGNAADLHDPHNYPIIGICLLCGELIRAENINADWRHLPDVIREELRKEAETIIPRPRLGNIWSRIRKPAGNA
jgi:hypothetical protein